MQQLVPRLPFAQTRLAVIQFVLVAIAFGALIWAFVTSDFSIQLVAKHSHSTKPLIYKISGVWGNHEGSMLLFVLIHSFLGALFALKPFSYAKALHERTLAVHASFTLALVFYLLFASNPFDSYWLPPLDGEGLNPMLQDPAMAIHPLMLYMGYVGYSMCFCFAIGLLGQKKLPPSWAEEMRIWAMLPWGFLTLGIALGSWWAYYELGWGGWWAWDPVENASLMPWLLGIALMHALAMARKKKGSYVIISLVLALVPFLMSIFGTFIVRSGLISSVHAFANDPERGIMLISFLAVVVLSAGFYTLRRLTILRHCEEPGDAAISSRKGNIPLKEKLIIANIIVLTFATLLVMMGTALPTLITTLGGPSFTLGPEFFNQTFVPLMAILLIFMPFGLRLAWKSPEIQFMKRLILPLSACVLIALLLAGAYGAIDLYVVFGVGLSLWLIAGTFLYLIQEKSLSFSKRFAIFLSHFGLGVTILGMVVSSHWHIETTTLLKQGTRLEFAGYYLTLDQLREVKGPNYLSLTADLRVEKGGVHITTLHPERRLYPVEQQSTHEVAIHTTFLSDLYVVLGAEDPLKRGWSAKLHYYPLVPFIWLGAFLMMFGCFLGLFIPLFSKVFHRNVI